MRRKLFLAALVLIAPLMMGATQCQDAAPAGKDAGSKQQAQSGPMHIRAWVTWDGRSNAGALEIRYAYPEGHGSGTDYRTTGKAGKWFRDATLNRNEAFVVYATQTTEGGVSCWFEEISPTGQSIGKISRVQYMVAANDEMECSYNRGTVD